MKLKSRYVIGVLIVAIMSGCYNRTRNNFEEQDSIGSVDMVISCDTIGDADDGIIHARMRYFDFDKIEDLGIFFDSISKEHPILIWMQAEDNTNELLKRAVSKIEAYRKGQGRFYPDNLVVACMNSISFNTVVVNNHRLGYTDMVCGECFMMCAAYYSPDITYLVQMQTPDHRAGIFNYGADYSGTSWWSYLFLKRKKGYEVACLGDYATARRIFLLEDEQKRKYYLCSNNNSALEFRQWLYWAKGGDEVVKVAECAEAPSNDEFTEYYFDRNRMIWKYARQDQATSKLMATSEMPALSLMLDGAKSRFVK